MHTEQRTQPIRYVVLHDNEGPEGAGSAQQLASYLLNNGPDGGGYQATFDDLHTVTVQPDSQVCWANGAINSVSVDGCIVGYASQTPQQWADQFDAGSPGVPGAIEEAARWFASRCRLYGIPPVHVTGSQLHDPDGRGICTHGDLTAAGYPGTEGHTDPGGNFPIGQFVARVAQILTPVPPVDWGALAALLAWQKRVAVRPLQYGNRSGDVQTMNDLLVKLGYLAKSGNFYGLRSWAAVHAFKQAHHWSAGTATGRVFGGYAAQAILT